MHGFGGAWQWRYESIEWGRGTVGQMGFGGSDSSQSEKAAELFRWVCQMDSQGVPRKSIVGSSSSYAGTNACKGCEIDL